MDPEVTLWAHKLAILTGWSEAEMLPYAQAVIDLPVGDRRLEKLWVALPGADEASEEGDWNLVARHDLEFVSELRKLKQ